VGHLHIGMGYYGKNYSVTPHNHPEIQIECILAGSARFVVDGRDIDLRAGHSLFIPPETEHRWFAKSPLLMVGITLNSSGPRRGEFIQECRGLFAESPLLVEAGNERTMHRLIRDMATPDEPALFSEQSAALFLGWLCRNIPKALDLEHWKVASNRPLTREERAVDLVGKATRFIQEHLDTPLRSSEVAKHVGLSSKQLNRLFDEFTEESVARTLQRIRLNKAMEMLQAHPEYSIEGIARDCGFNSHSYFTHRFIAAFGVRPSDIRESNPR
jgi:AraC-like DNA-binding protein